MFEFNVFSLFPEVFESYLGVSIVRRAIDLGLIKINLHNIRDWTNDKHRTTDDLPYGGGGGMIMKPEPIFTAVEDVLGSPPGCPIILLTPQGRLFTQTMAEEIASLCTSTNSMDQIKVEKLGLICGRYEGVDERVREHLVTEEISVGDYVLTGGELPALVIIDAVTRLIPGALGDPCGAECDSHSTGLLEYPHYTRPAEFRNWRVPDVLLSGDHARINRWRREQSLLRTLRRRPDLLKSANISQVDDEFLSSFEGDENDEK